MADPKFQRLVQKSQSDKVEEEPLMKEAQLLVLKHFDDVIDAYSYDEPTDDEMMEDAELNEIDLNELGDNDVYEAEPSLGDELMERFPVEFDPAGLPMPEEELNQLSAESIYLLFLFGVCIFTSIMLYAFKK